MPTNKHSVTTFVNKDKLKKKLKKYNSSTKNLKYILSRTARISDPKTNEVFAIFSIKKTWNNAE